MVVCGVTVDRAKDPDVGIVAFDWQVRYLGSSILLEMNWSRHC